MRKIQDLNSLELFQFLNIIEPMLSPILDTESVKASLGGVVSQKIIDASVEWQKELDKKNPSQTSLAKARLLLELVSAEAVIGDIKMVLPVLLANEAKTFEAVAFLAEVDVEEVKKWEGFKFINTLTNILKEADFKVFLGLSGQSELKE